MAASSFSSCSAEETEAIGAQLARELRPGSVVLVRGEVGAGKTTLVRGAARALGVQGAVTSPTFTIGNRYRAGQLTVSHLDLYRLAELEREEQELLEDYLGGGAVVFIEWPEKGASTLVAAGMWVTLTHRGGDQREVQIERQPAAAGAWGEQRV